MLTASPRALSMRILPSLPIVTGLSKLWSNVSISKKPCINVWTIPSVLIALSVQTPQPFRSNCLLKTCQQHSDSDLPSPIISTRCAICACSNWCAAPIPPMMSLTGWPILTTACLARALCAVLIPPDFWVTGSVYLHCRLALTRPFAVA